MWKNKHLIAAMIIAPILAIIAYFSVDAMVSEKPHAARAGESYPLRVMSNCRYESGECELRNGDVRLRLTRADDGRWLLEAELPLDGAMLSAASESEPAALSVEGEQRRRWRGIINKAAVERGDALRLVVATGGSHYFAEVPTVFVEEAASLGR